MTDAHESADTQKHTALIEVHRALGAKLVGFGGWEMPLGKIEPGRAQYTHLLDESDASVVDDIIVWWVDEDVFDVMPNASNTDRVVAAIGGRDTTADRSIIAVQGDGDFHKGKDGLVAYDSAHVSYVESEFIVRGPHSCQGMPPTIEEVRRILHEHLDQSVK